MDRYADARWERSSVEMKRRVRLVRAQDVPHDVLESERILRPRGADGAHAHGMRNACRGPRMKKRTSETGRVLLKCTHDRRILSKSQKYHWCTASERTQYTVSMQAVRGRRFRIDGHKNKNLGEEGG